MNDKIAEFRKQCIVREQHKQATTALKEALAQLKQEPVAWHVDFGNEDEPNYACLEKPDEPRAVNVRPLIYGDTSPPQRKPLSDEQAHQTLLDMASHIEDFGNEDTTQEQLSGECVRFILERVAAHGIKEES
jgi:hypothetical protein